MDFGPAEPEGGAAVSRKIIGIQWVEIGLLLISAVGWIAG
jgi:hypothetical protein